MDTLKLNKILLFLFLFSLLSCNDKEKKIEDADFCAQDSIIHYRHNELSIWFVQNKKKSDIKKIEIYHIRNKKNLSKLAFTELKDNEIDFTVLPELHTKDSLKVILNDRKIIYLYNFKNEPNYGGKIFLGCYLFTYTSDGQEYSLIDRSKIQIFLE